MFTDNYFQFIYQYVQSDISRILTEEKNVENWKSLFYKNNLLELLNDIYRTRLSKKGIIALRDKLLIHNDWDNYYETLSLFLKINPSIRSGMTIMKNALSLGTKVLHTYDPNKNPIMDDIILTNLDFKKESTIYGIDFCVYMKDAFNMFYDEHHEYFDFPSDLQSYLRDINIVVNIPIMKILDITLYKKG